VESDATCESLRKELEELQTTTQQRHQQEIARTKNEYEQMLDEIKQIHAKDKQFLEELLRKAEERVKRGSKDSQNYMEMENKYLRDIKDLNDSFDEYKKQVEKHILSLNREKASLQK